MSELSKGMVVQLASGGPKMTVMALGDYSPVAEDGAKCVWFDDKKVRQEAVFDVAVLKEFRSSTAGLAGRSSRDW